MLRRAFAIAALLLATLTPGSTAHADPAPLRILAIGDSITAGNTSTGSGRWQDELDRLLTEAGVAHTIYTQAVAGSRCDYWPSRMPSILATYQPQLVILDCGTNDDPAATCFGEPCTGWAFRSIVEAAHAAGAMVLPTLVGYSDATMAPSWLLPDEAWVNDTLWRNAQYYQLPRTTPSWFAGIADLQVMPGTAVYLDGDGCDPRVASCGIHPNAKGYRTVARLMYDAAAPSMGWPAALTLGEPVLCGMSGHRTGYPRPTYTPCPA